MNDSINRRDFIKTGALAGAALAFSNGLSSHVLGAENASVTLAFVGCAHIHTPGFIELLKRTPSVKVKYVWDHEEARAARRAKELSAKQVTDLKEIWNDEEVKGVVICSETNRHLDLVKQAAKAGKHMFVEKPLGITGKESYAMAEAIDRAGLLFTTGYFMRTSPQHLFLKEQVAQGNFGKITRIRGSNCHSGSLGGWFDTEWRWMADPKIAGVGAFGDLGTHSLDILMWLMGEVERVTADIQIITGRYEGCDETGEALIHFKNGVIGTLAGGWVDVANPVTLLISGTEGHATIVNDKLFFQSKKVEGANGREPWIQLPPSPPVPLTQFVNALQGKPNQPLVTPREAAARVSVMEAMYKASNSKDWVKPA